MRSGAASASKALGLAAAVAGCIAYTLLAHHAASAPNPGIVEAAIIVVPILLVALVFGWQASHRPATRAAWLLLWLVACGSSFAARDWLVGHHNWLLLLQHVAINALACLLFLRSLAPGATPMVTHFARFAHGGDLTPRVVRYTRQVTWAWVVYFVVTIAVSLALFAHASPTAWSTFVNLLSLPLLGAMFALEYAARVILIPPAERSGFVQAIRGYRQWSEERAARPRHTSG